MRNLFHNVFFFRNSPRKNNGPASSPRSLTAYDSGTRCSSCSEIFMFISAVLTVRLAAISSLFCYLSLSTSLISDCSFSKESFCWARRSHSCCSRCSLVALRSLISNTSVNALSTCSLFSWLR